MDEKPRMTAEEADARFAALVAEHRAARPARTRGPRVSSLPASLKANLAIAAVFVVGVVAGAAWHTKAIGVAILGIPLVLVARALLFGRADSGAGARDDEGAPQ